MKTILLTLVIFTSISLSLSAQNHPRTIRQFELDERVVYNIPVPFEQGVTTFLFPSALQGLSGSNIVSEPSREGGDFLLSYTPGQHYFNLRALKPQARGTLNVIFQNKAYIINLGAGSTPYHSVTFFQTAGGSRQKAGLTPTRLLGLLDKAKAYPLLREHHPDVVSNVAHFQPPNQVMQYVGFDVHVEEVFRFEQEDTLAFKIRLRNHTDEAIRYKPDHLAVRVGNRIYYQSIVDASGIMPPQSTVPAYFAISGTPKGGRNNLSVINNWNVLVARAHPLRPSHVSPDTPTTNTDTPALSSEEIPKFSESGHATLRPEFVEAGSK